MIALVKNEEGQALRVACAQVTCEIPLGQNIARHVTVLENGVLVEAVRDDGHVEWSAFTEYTTQGQPR